MSNLNGEYYTQLSLDKNRVQVMVKSLIDKNGVLRFVLLLEFDHNSRKLDIMMTILQKKLQSGQGR